MKRAINFSLLIVLFITLSCGITVKSYNEKALNSLKVRVEVENNSFEAGVTYIFKDACQSALFKRGANIVDVNEDLLLHLIIREIKSAPVSFNINDIATNYNLYINGTYRIFKIEKSGKRLLQENNFSLLQTYGTANVELAEIKRQLSIMQAARELSQEIKDKISMLLEQLP